MKIHLIFFSLSLVTIAQHQNLITADFPLKVIRHKESILKPPAQLLNLTKQTIQSVLSVLKNPESNNESLRFLILKRPQLPESVFKQIIFRTITIFFKNCDKEQQEKLFRKVFLNSKNKGLMRHCYQLAKKLNGESAAILDQQTKYKVLHSEIKRQFKILTKESFTNRINDSLMCKEITSAMAKKLHRLNRCLYKKTNAKK